MIRLRKLLMMNWTISPLFLSSHTVQCIYYATLLSLMQHAGLGWARHRLCQLTVYWRNYTSLVKSAQVCQKWWPGAAMQCCLTTVGMARFMTHFAHWMLFLPFSSVFHAFFNAHLCPLCQRILPSKIYDLTRTFLPHWFRCPWWRHDFFTEKFHWLLVTVFGLF